MKSSFVTAILGILLVSSAPAQADSEALHFYRLKQAMKSPGALQIPEIGREGGAQDTTFEVKVVSLVGEDDLPYPYGNTDDAFNQLVRDSIHGVFKDSWDSKGPADDLKLLTGGFSDVSVAFHSGSDRSVSQDFFLSLVTPSRRAEIEKLVDGTLLNPLFCTYTVLHIYDRGSDIRGDVLVLIRAHDVDQAIVIRIYYAHT